MLKNKRKKWGLSLFPRVLITRPEEKSLDFSSQLKALGVRPLIFPLTKIASPKSFRALDRSFNEWNEFDLVIFTSALAVQFFFLRAKDLNFRLSQPKILYAIGPQTKEALKAVGFQKVKMPREFRAEGLLEELKNVKGLRILIPRAKEAREILPRALRKRGALVEVPTVYQVLPHQKYIIRLKRMSEKDFDAVVFASGRSVKEFVKAFGILKSRKLFLKIPAVSIGPVTTKALRNFGISAVQSQSPNQAGLIAALKKVL